MFDLQLNRDGSILYATSFPAGAPPDSLAGVILGITPSSGHVQFETEIDTCQQCAYLTIAAGRGRLYYAASWLFNNPPATIASVGLDGEILSRRLANVDASDIAVSEAKGELYVLDRLGGRVVVFNLDTVDSTSFAPAPPLPPGGGPPGSRWSPAPLLAGTLMMLAGAALLVAARRRAV